jgi:hypothetical protein
MLDEFAALIRQGRSELWYSHPSSPDGTK